MAILAQGFFRWVGFSGSFGNRNRRMSGWGATSSEKALPTAESGMILVIRGDMVRGLPPLTFHGDVVVGGANSARGQHKVVEGRERPDFRGNGVELVWHHHRPADLHAHLPQPLAQEVRVGVLDMTLQDLIANDCNTDTDHSGAHALMHYRECQVQPLAHLVI